MSALAKGKVHWGWERLVDFNTSTNNSPKMTIFPIPFKEGKYDYIEINYIRKIMLSKNIPSYAILFSQFSTTQHNLNESFNTEFCLLNITCCLNSLTFLSWCWMVMLSFMLSSLRYFLLRGTFRIVLYVFHPLANICLINHY